MERTNSNTVRIMDMRPTHDGNTWLLYCLKDNGNMILVQAAPHLRGLCLAVGFVGTGGRNIN